MNLFPVALLQGVHKYREHYFPQLGSFSFYPGRSGRFYYGAPVSRGRAEPDIHGTMMFIWGISMFIRMLGLPDGEEHFLEIGA